VRLRTECGKQLALVGEMIMGCARRYADLARRFAEAEILRTAAAHPFERNRDQRALKVAMMIGLFRHFHVSNAYIYG
jgi:hypothetical protein